MHNGSDQQGGVVFDLFLKYFSVLLYIIIFSTLDFIWNYYTRYFSVKPFEVAPLIVSNNIFVKMMVEV